jgi:nitrite reductase/ring-hydroxylating ferredoxin subunit
MLSPEDNIRITQVGPGTPAGAWLRRFWHPIAISDRWDGIRTHWDYDRPLTFDGEPGTVGSWADRLGNFRGKPTAVRILGEDLILFRDGAGRPGLIQRTCPHRGTSFEYGRIQDRGISCCYHGWLFDVGGRCLDMPAEPPGSTFRDKVTITAYPVAEMGGLLWAYLGPGEPPALPRFDAYAREDGVRAVENFGLWPANWLQICENSVDQAHTGILHGGGGGERADIWGTELPRTTWEAVELGIKATAARPGMNYTRTSYYIMPTMNRLPQPWPGGRFKWPRFSAIWRTPVDDRHTLFFSVCFTPEVDGRLPDLPDGMDFHVSDQLLVHREQDFQAIVSQGPVFDRATERLATSDEGVILLRRLVMDGIAAVERGEDPLGARRHADPGEVIDLQGAVMDGLNRLQPA